MLEDRLRIQLAENVSRKRVLRAVPNETSEKQRVLKPNTSFTLVLAHDKVA
jgi:hypothetical protein